MSHATLDRLHLFTYELILVLWIAAPACLLTDACWWHLFGHTCTGIKWDIYLATMAGFWSLIVPMMAALSSS